MEVKDAGVRESGMVNLSAGGDLKLILASCCHPALHKIPVAGPGREVTGPALAICFRKVVKK